MGGNHSLSQGGGHLALSPPQVKTHLQAQTLAAVAVGHQHNHEVRGDGGRGRGQDDTIWWHLGRAGAGTQRGRCYFGHRVFKAAVWQLGPV